jgi:transketolase
VASEILEQQGVSLAVINQPWLNAFDIEWLAAIIEPYSTLFVLEDHGVTGALGDHLLAVLVRHKLLGKRLVEIFGVEGLPACGTPAETLGAHQLDGASLARRVVASLELRPA